MKHPRRLLAMSQLGLSAMLIAACAPPARSGIPGGTPEGGATAIATVTAAEARTTPTPDETAGLIVEEGDPFEGMNLRFDPDYWERTNFEIHSVPYEEIRSGGPPPDGIPAIDDPHFESLEAAAQWLGDDWPVILFQWNGQARAYPLAILIWHEIANDVVGGEPVAVTFCPLCNASIVFKRTLGDGTVLDFGTTGNLRNSDLVMYDRQTESWWQQFTGEAIVGEMTGEKLEFMPSQIISYSDFASQYPKGMVLSRDTGHRRSYGQNPYGGYDSIDSSPFAFEGETDGRLPPLERVVAVDVQGEQAAYPFSQLAEVRVVNDVVGGQPIAVFWKSGTRSTFGSSTADTGSTGAFSRRVGDQVLTFTDSEAKFVDQETGSTWDLLGNATSGPMSGETLDRLVSGEHFWFAWAAFLPNTRVWSPD